jgi:hypothetical protein
MVPKMRAAIAAFLAASALTVAWAPAPPASADSAGGSISGTLTLEAEPPGESRGFVELFPSDGGSSIRYTATDAAGNFTITGVAPGSYKLAFCTDVISSHSPFGYACRYYRDGIFETATIIEVGDAPVVGIDQTIRAVALAQGVLGPRSEGIYLPTAAFFPAEWTSGTPDWTSPHIVWASAKDGVYGVGLEPGDYRVAFGSRLDTVRRYDFEHVEYWGGATPADSKVLRVRSGEQVTVNGMGAPEFADVLVRDQFALEIAWLATHGVTTGYADGGYHPSAPMSREAMAVFLYRMAGSPVVDPGWAVRFWDVPSSHPFFREITWLAAQGVTSGYPDGTFRPAAPVNRDAMAAFLYRSAGSPAWEPGASRFTDVPSGAAFSTEIDWLAARRITTGYADGTFHPLAPVSRDAMAAFLFRFDRFGA